MALPLLLLDIDGVLNPFAAPACPDGYREYACFPEDDPPVRLRAAHGPWLRTLSRTFDLAWATGWEDEADVFLAPALELPALPMVRFPPVPFDPAGKAPAVDAFAGDRPAAWVDDAHTEAGTAWVRSRTAPALLLPSDPARGLTAEMVAALHAWRPAL